MCVSIINGEISNHTIQEKEPPKNKEKDSTVISAVILRPSNRVISNDF